MKLMSTRPQTLTYALTIPRSAARWIVEKFSEWTGSSGVPEERRA